MNGLLRVGGRLQKSTLSDARKYLILLHAKSHFCKLLATHVHEKYFHAGRKFVTSVIASRFHVVGGITNVVKFVIRSCVTCIRFQGETATQLWEICRHLE